MRCSFRMSGSSVIEAQGVGGVALGARRLLVDLHEHRVDAGGDAGRRQRLDVLRQARRHAVAGARQLQAVRDVEDDRIAELAQHRKRAHVHDQVVVAEADAALGDEHRCCLRAVTLAIDVPHVVRREKLALLDVHGLAGPRRGHQQIRLARQERRNLQDVGDRGGRRRLRRLVDVGEDRQPGRAPSPRPAPRRPASRPGPRNDVADVRFALSNDALKMTGTPQRWPISRIARASAERVRRRSR